ncbi:hypothetical protein A4G99_07060 [Haladaptatus sp. R4]|uniref:hypothetical protein n=1 Tax=Haladaptatus sp. R4 TaxID=1679489 RepID=UPI0007B46338|nr:hypothetical protein [Haladaptatus sp. R4]KZN24195.1 hypothetical protein A4G99_07060 [Haladaptatus sp. R4]
MTDFVSQEVDCTILIEGLPYLVTDMNVKTTQYNEADMCQATVVPDGHQFQPNAGNDAAVTINDDLVYTGYVREANNNADGSYDVKLLDAIHLLQSGRVNISTDTQIPASDLLRNHLFPQCNVENFEIDLASKAESHLASKLGLSGSYGLPVDNDIVLDRTEAPGNKVLDDVATMCNAVWWVDIEGTIHVGQPEYRYHGELTYILENGNTPGKLTPAYQSVVVRGDGVVSAGGKGWQTRNLISKEGVKSTRTLKNLGATQEEAKEISQRDKVEYAVEEGTLTPPTFTVTIPELKTQSQADAAANRLASKLIEQAGKGHVKVCGRSDIQVCDSFKMPDELGGAIYQVSGIEHIVNSSDGFVSKIYCGGVLQP